MSKSILITGGCGFVGSNLAISFKQKYPDYKIICLDNLKRRGSELNINRLKTNDIEFVHGDIRNKEDLAGLPDLTTIIDAAAEPSVLAGLGTGTEYVVQTNFNGTVNTLDLALEKKADFVFLSTSRVYPIAKIEEIVWYEAPTRFMISPKQKIQTGLGDFGIAEDFPLEGARSLYGATKLSSELMIREYCEMLGVKSVINRCGVLTGPYQMGKVDQGVIVLWVARHFWKKGLSYFGYGGEGKQVRDILDVSDLFRLVDIQVHDMNKVNGQVYNVGGGRDISVSLAELTAICEEVTGNKIPMGSVPETRQADIRIYLSDYRKVKRELGWEPKVTPKEIINNIYLWIRDNEAQLKPILN